MLFTFLKNNYTLGSEKPNKKRICSLISILNCVENNFFKTDLNQNPLKNKKKSKK